MAHPPAWLKDEICHATNLRGSALWLIGCLLQGEVWHTMKDLAIFFDEIDNLCQAPFQLLHKECQNSYVPCQTSEPGKVMLLHAVCQE